MWETEEHCNLKICFGRVFGPWIQGVDWQI